MVKVEYINLWNTSLSMLLGTSPKITFQCGTCHNISSCRIPMKAIQSGKPYVVCPYCGETNDTMLHIKA